MPTLRLTDSDKSWIVSSFSTPLHRCTNSLPFPLKETKDIEEWVQDCIPVKIWDSWKYLMDNCRSTVSHLGYTKIAFVETDDGTGNKYRIFLYGSDTGCWPHYEPTCKKGDLHYEEILKWAKQYAAVQEQVDEAMRYMQRGVWACTSAGQIARIFPENVLRFLPSRAGSSLSNAERKSRVPSGFEINHETCDLLERMLALGTISPNSQEGFDAAASIE
jgi:hypothetical protein